MAEAEEGEELTLHLQEQPSVEEAVDVSSAGASVVDHLCLAAQGIEAQTSPGEEAEVGDRSTQMSGRRTSPW